MYFKTTNVAGLRLFYREAGDLSKPTIVLLHGFPSSSTLSYMTSIIRMCSSTCISSARRSIPRA